MGDIAARSHLGARASGEHNTLALPKAYAGVQLPALIEAEKTYMEYRATGLSTGHHPIAMYCAQLTRRSILSSIQLKQAQQGIYVWAAGLKVVYQSPPTAIGHHFITLENEFDFINLIVKPSAYVQLRRVTRLALLVLARGKVQQAGGVKNLIVDQCVELNEQIISKYSAWYGQ